MIQNALLNDYSRIQNLTCDGGSPASSLNSRTFAPSRFRRPKPSAETIDAAHSPLPVISTKSLLCRLQWPLIGLQSSTMLLLDSIDLKGTKAKH
jgi:hypothetical protein